MLKIKLLFACFCVVLLVSMFILACSPAAPSAPAAPIKTTYAAKTYANDEYGFSFQYPSSMVAAAKPKAKYGLFEAADAMQVPAVSASALDTPKVEEQTKESLESVGGSDIKTVSSEPTTLLDGKTEATLTKLSWKSSGYNITTYSLATEKGTKTISVSYTSLADMINEKIAKEVVYTLTLK